MTAYEDLLKIEESIPFRPSLLNREGVPAFPEIPPFVARMWQKQGGVKLNEKLLEGASDFLLNACPAAGKTPFGINACKGILDMGKGNFLVILVPSRTVRRQWVKAGFNQGMRLTGKYNTDDISYGVADDVIGIVLTYAMVCQAPLNYQALCEKYNVVVILDEIHHLGDAENIKWGQAIKTAFSNAVFRLSLSGTPFRSDGNPIPFVTYGEDGVCVPDFTYSYSEGINDGVCRVVSFPVHEGRMEWMDGPDLIKAGFEDDLDEKGASRRLRTALSIKGSLLPNMIASAHDKLREIRASGHEDAAGLVCAVDIRHALEIAEWMKRNLQVDAVVVHSDTPGSADIVERFGDSKELWIIAVRMISEGVDIKRLRVGVYATNLTTEMFFRQFIGRFVRWMAELKCPQGAFVYIPGDKRIVTLASLIESEVRNAVGERENRKPREPGPEIDYPPCDFLPIGAEGWEDRHISREKTYPIHEVEAARRWQINHPETRGMQEPALIDLLRRIPGAIPDPKSITTARFEAFGAVDPDTENTNLRDQGTELNGRIMRILVPDAASRTDEDWRKLNGYFSKKAGIPTGDRGGVRLATNDQLRARRTEQQAVIEILKNREAVDHVRWEILRRDG